MSPGGFRNVWNPVSPGASRSSSKGPCVAFSRPTNGRRRWKSGDAHPICPMRFGGTPPNSAYDLSLTTMRTRSTTTFTASRSARTEGALCRWPGAAKSSRRDCRAPSRATRLRGCPTIPTVVSGRPGAIPLASRQGLQPDRLWLAEHDAQARRYRRPDSRPAFRARRPPSRIPSSQRLISKGRSSSLE